jgi:AP-1 complex subunit beta-1
MTVGKDVSSLFMDVVNCIQTGCVTPRMHSVIVILFSIDNLELKKLVYLYLINYAKTQPEQAILAVNTFVKDANDPVSLVY